MADVIVFKGAVSFPITLDPSVWIFDDRKIDLRTYKGDSEQDGADQANYLKGTGAQWDKELREGAALPSERKSLVEERKALEGDFGMRLGPFIDNAKPLPEATHMIIRREGGSDVTLSLMDAKRAILQFAKNGKPIRDQGPVHLYLPETWMTGGEPIHSIISFEFVSNQQA